MIMFMIYIMIAVFVLNYSTTTREGYKQYKSDAKVCKKCNLIEYCTHSKNTTKIVIRPVWEDYIDLVEDILIIEG